MKVFLGTFLAGMLLLICGDSLAGLTNQQNQRNSVPSVATIASMQSTKNDNQIETDRVEIKILETRVNDLSDALLEQTGIFSAIIVITLAIAGFITYRGLRSEFNEKVDNLRSQLKQEDEKSQTSLLKTMDELSGKLINEDSNRDKLLTEKLEKETKRLDSRIHRALANVYRALAYALEERDPEAATIWMLRCAKSLHRAKPTIAVSSEFIKGRLQEVYDYAARITSKGVFSDFSDEALKIVDMLSVYSESEDTLKNIRIEFNRILSLEDD